MIMNNLEMSCSFSSNINGDMTSSSKQIFIIKRASLIIDYLENRKSSLLKVQLHDRKRYVFLVTWSVESYEM